MRSNFGPCQLFCPQTWNNSAFSDIMSACVLTSRPNQVTLKTATSICCDSTCLKRYRYLQESRATKYTFYNVPDRHIDNLHDTAIKPEAHNKETANQYEHAQAKVGSIIRQYRKRKRVLGQPEVERDILRDTIGKGRIRPRSLGGPSRRRLPFRSEYRESRTVSRVTTGGGF